MQTELMRFNVVPHGPVDTPPLKTWITHEVQGERNTIRIEQESVTPDKENDVALLDISDFKTIAKLLQGH